MNPDLSFWQAMAEPGRTHPIVTDRPGGSAHPRFPGVIYPLDHGDLLNSTSGDGAGIDVWLGSLHPANEDKANQTLTGILCTFDTLKHAAEIKLLINCSAKDIRVIRDFHRKMHTLYIRNPMVGNDVPG